MKVLKSLLSLLLLAVFIPLIADESNPAPLTTPDPGKQYFIYHSSNYILSWEGNKLCIMSPGASENQKVKFVPVEGQEGVYNIMFTTLEGQYIYKNGYNASLTTDGSKDEAKYQIKLSHVPEQYVFLRNVNSIGGLGTDNNNDGSTVYTDKQRNDGKDCWYIVEATDGLITTSLDGQIAAAEALAETEGLDSRLVSYLNDKVAEANGILASATKQSEINDAAAALTLTVSRVKSLANAIKTLADADRGDAPGQYSEDVCETFNTVIEETIDSLVNATADTDLASVFNNLSAAQSTFVNATNGLDLDPEKDYIVIQNASGLIWTLTGKDLTVKTPEISDAQKIRFIPIEGRKNFYNVRYNDGSYFCLDGSWSTTTTDDPNKAEAAVFVKLYNADKNEVLFAKGTNTSNFFATDPNDPKVYTNKWALNNDGTIGNSVALYTIQEYEEGKPFTFALEKDIESAEETAAKAVIGDELWNTPAEAVNALKAAIEEARTALESATTQEEITEASNKLKEAVSAFDAAQIRPTFAPKAGEKFRYSVAKYPDNFMTLKEDGTGIQTAGFESGNTRQQWEFVQTSEGYKAVNGGVALNPDLTIVPVDEAESWQFIYTNTDTQYIHRFGFVSDGNKVLTFGSGTNPVKQDFSASNNAHQGRFTSVDPTNDPNRTELERVIAYGKEWLRYVTYEGHRGTEMGMWSDSKCEALDAAVKAAEALSGLTQEETDAAAKNLNATITDFINHPNSVEKGNLDEMLAQLKEIKDNAVVGTEKGQFFQSDIDKMEADYADFAERAANTSEQEAVDALAEEIAEYLDTVKGHTEAQAIADVFADALASAKALRESVTEDMIGINKGQYSKAAADAFDAALANAEAVETPTADDLAALQDARKAFLAGKVTFDRTPLINAIAEAKGEEFQNLVAGEFDGNYDAEKIDAFKKALADAEEMAESADLTQEQYTTLLNALRDAMKNLRASKVTINFKNLDQAILAATNLLGTTTAVGDGEGQLAQAKFDEFKGKVDAAAAIDRAAIVQTDVDKTADDLTLATIQFHTDIVTSTGIEALAAEAKAKADAAKVGLTPGSYPCTAVNALNSAVTSANEVIANTASTQAELLEAVAALKAAIEKFEKSVIPSNDVESLTALVAEVEKFIADHSLENANLNRALAVARDILADPDNYTQDDVDDAEKDLKNAYNLAMSNVGGMMVEGLTISIFNGVLTVSNVETEAFVAVYTVNGQTVAAEKVVSNWSLDLAEGTYVIAVSANGKREARTVRIAR